MRFLPLVAVAAALSIGASPAHAQYPQRRAGFWFNAGIGYGSLGCDDCDGRRGSLSFGLSLGGTISRKVLLGGGMAIWSKDEGIAKTTIVTLDARIRFYPSATGGFFLTGGLGIGTIQIDIDNLGEDKETGVAVLLGLGYDIRIARTLSITPFLNGFGVRNDNADANVGQIGVSVTAH